MATKLVQDRLVLLVRKAQLAQPAQKFQDQPAQLEILVQLVLPDLPVQGQQGQLVQLGMQVQLAQPAIRVQQDRLEI